MAASAERSTPMASYTDLSRPPLHPVGKEEKKKWEGKSFKIFSTENVVEQTQCLQSVLSCIKEMNAVKDCTFMSFVDCISKECCTVRERTVLCLFSGASQ